MGGEFGAEKNALRHWDKDPTLGFPPLIIIRKHRYCSRPLEKFKAAAVEGARWACQQHRQH